MGRAGIDASAFVIAYGSLGGAERLWWLLRHFGHSAAAVIDLEAWRGPLTDGAEQADTAAASARARAATTRSSWIELAARLDELVVLDARLPARYRGEPNPVDRVPGRMPGAVNAPWNEPLATLPAGEIVVYCGSGITACVVLHQLALPEARVACTPARGRSGSSTPSCRRSVAERANASGGGRRGPQGTA